MHVIFARASDTSRDTCACPLPVAVTPGSSPLVRSSAGARRWDCASVSVRQTSSPDRTRHFTVTGSGGAPEFELPYSAADSGPFDPAYDWLDELADDCCLWVADRLATAASRQTLLEHFRAGFPAI
ncbi:hypothetical protein DEJ49_35370 [Streptomyces venezuelae]|uniref:Uncharacterized protein n=2 Tax=Streptomyces venezuelae TaxID=54571 RepID=A0A5P2CTF8_STRVZ|nr:hypothetical protein DEJ49_35370 [Streptomyces venezuelae]